MFAATSSRCGGLALLFALLCASAAAPAWGAVPGGYAVQRVDNDAAPTADLRFGSPVANVGDVNEDGTNDVAIGLPTADGGEGQVLVVSGATGAGIHRIRAPAEDATSGGAAAAFGGAVAPLGDVLRCASGSPGTDCGNKSMSKDGSPEFLVGATGGDVSSATERTLDQGRVYVIDGATGAVASRITLDIDDVPVSGKAEFGHSVLSFGDMDGDGLPDIVVGAPGYSESDSGNCPGATCVQAGRAYVYFASQLSITASTSVQAPQVIVENPFAADDPASQRFGHSLAPLADIGECTNQAGGDRRCLDLDGPDNVPSNTPDGKRDFLVSAPLLDQGATADAGAAFVVEGKNGLIIKRIDAVGAQAGGRFGVFSYQSPAPPDMGGAARADIFVGAPHHGSGQAFVIDSDVTTSSTLGSLADPSPLDGGRFGWAGSGIGAGGYALGAPFGARPGTVRIFNPDRSLAQTICHPDNQSEAEFGASIASLGDSNADGFDEFAIGAPGFDHPSGAGNAGRVYILTSKGPAAAGAPDACVSTDGGTTGDGGGGGGNGGDGVGADEATPPGDGKVVIARVLRRLVLKPDRKRVRKASSFRLRGTLTASANRSVCQRRQKIALQRRKSSGARFQTFEVAVTRANGKFTARAIAGRTYQYRARVSQTSRCMGAVSKVAKVKVLRQSGSL